MNLYEREQIAVAAKAFDSRRQLIKWTDPWDGKQKVMERHQHGPRAVEQLPPGITSDAAGRWSFSPSAKDRVAADHEDKAREEVRRKKVAEAAEAAAQVPKAVPVAPLRTGDRVRWKLAHDYHYEVVRDQEGAHVLLRALNMYHSTDPSAVYNEPADKVEVLPAEVEVAVVPRGPKVGDLVRTKNELSPGWSGLIVEVTGVFKNGAIRGTVVDEGTSCLFPKGHFASGENSGRDGWCFDLGHYDVLYQGAAT